MNKFVITINEKDSYNIGNFLKTLTIDGDKILKNGKVFIKKTDIVRDYHTGKHIDFDFLTTKIIASRIPILNGIMDLISNI